MNITLVSLAKKFHVTRASWIIRIDHYDKWEGRLVLCVNYRFQVIARTSANSQFPMANWRYRSSDRTYTPSPLAFLYTIFDNPASPAPANAYAMRRTPLETVRYLPLTVRRLRFHREHQVRLVARVFIGVL